MDARRGRQAWPLLAVGLALALLVTGVFAEVGTHPFAPLDDRDYVQENPVVREGLTWAGVRWALTTRHASNWHPLTWLSHMLDVELFGMRPGPHHLVSVGLHAAGTVALFLALVALTGTRWPSALAAALFAAHPLHVESVVWIAERKDVLSTLLGLLALLAWRRYARRPSVGRYLPVAGLFALGLLAKPMLVTLPLVLLLLDVWPLGRLGPQGFSAGRAARLAFEKVPLLALSAAAAALTLAAQRGGATLVSLRRLPLAERLDGALASYLAYLRQTVWPAGLAVYYPREAGASAAWLTAAAAAVLLGATAATLLARRRPWLAVGWLWYLGTLVPVIGLVQAGLQARADRYTYLPLVGIFIAAAWELARAARGRRAAAVAVAGAAAVAAVAACAVASRAQVSRWRDPETLLASAIAATGDNWLAQLNLGVSLLDRGRPAEALRHLEEARRLQPWYAGAYYNLGLANMKLGRLELAVGYYVKAVRLDPSDPETRNNLGTALDSLGRYEEAVEQYRAAVRLKPHAASYENLARTLRRLGRRDEAAAALGEARRLAGGRRP